MTPTPSTGECFISVDVETSGPIPGDVQHARRSGRAWSARPGEGFYVELKPLNGNAVPEAVAVTGFDLARGSSRRDEPAEAMRWSKLFAWVGRGRRGRQAGVRRVQRRHSIGRS